MSRPPHLLRLYNSNYTWRRVQIIYITLPFKTIHSLAIDILVQQHPKTIHLEVITSVSLQLDGSRDSSVGLASDYKLDILAVSVPVSVRALSVSSPQVIGEYSMWVKSVELAADHSPPNIVEAKKRGSIRLLQIYLNFAVVN
jgi:hypothetical protein